MNCLCDQNSSTCFLVLYTFEQLFSIEHMHASSCISVLSSWCSPRFFSHYVSTPGNLCYSEPLQRSPSWHTWTTRSGPCTSPTQILWQQTNKIDIFYWIPGTKPSSLQNLVPLQHSSIMQRFMIDDTKFINHCIDKYDRLTPVKGECKVWHNLRVWRVTYPKVHVCSNRVSLGCIIYRVSMNMHDGHDT